MYMCVFVFVCECVCVYTGGIRAYWAGLPAKLLSSFRLFSFFSAFNFAGKRQERGVKKENESLNESQC